jgi:hypothetical protein|tara:strand:+ start:785 stop:973 length:189 start_codon:yes stop_codon:yes gene_type:complete
MGVAVEKKKKEFIDLGFPKKEATIKAHEWCKLTNTCRGCSQPVATSEWSNSYKGEGYCMGCM